VRCAQEVGIDQEFSPGGNGQGLPVGQRQLKTCPVLGNDLLAFLYFVANAQGPAIAGCIDQPGLAFQDYNDATRLSGILIGSHGSLSDTATLDCCTLNSFLAFVYCP
jgi:hypothetical protein